jgi:hypothetical protein
MFNVASGRFATIAGGLSHNAPGLGSFIGGGQSNLVGGAYGIIAGGFNNSVYGTHSFLGSGADNTITPNAPYSFIGSGHNNQVADQYTFIAGGSFNQIDAGAYGSSILGGRNHAIQSGSYRSSIGGGENNLISSNAPLSFIPGGRTARTTCWGQMAHAAGGFALNGDAQASQYVVRGQTTTTNFTELFLDGASRRMVVPNNGLWSFEVVVAGKDNQTWGLGAGFKFEGVIMNNNGTVEFLGTPIKTALGANYFFLDATIVADNANDALVVKAKGGAVSPDVFRWVAVVRTTEVINN